MCRFRIVSLNEANTNKLINTVYCQINNQKYLKINSTSRKITPTTRDPGIYIAQGSEIQSQISQINVVMG